MMIPVQRSNAATRGRRGWVGHSGGWSSKARGSHDQGRVADSTHMRPTSTVCPLLEGRR
jgi:hypothetical protein